jgi:lipopolysaccharide transport system permease protein
MQSSELREAVSEAPAALASTGVHRPRPLKRIRPAAFSFGNLIQAQKDLYEYRNLLFTLSMHRLKIRYKQSLLGWAWALLQPLSLMLIYTIIFSVVTRIPTGKIPYVLFVLSALVPWLYFSTIVTNAATSLVSHSQLITKVFFPREILPLTYVIAGFIDFLVAGLLLGGMLVYYRVPINQNTLYIFPAMAIITLIGTSLALLLSALQVRLRDIGLAIPLVMQLWMFATPVVYPLSAVPARLRPWYILNPLVGAIETFRRVLVENQPPDFSALQSSALMAAIIFPLAYMFFKRRESSMADVV